MASVFCLVLMPTGLQSHSLVWIIIIILFNILLELAAW